jgi:8-oxo-dGTP pyrophosphatase MutT (NUDIX family)
MDDKFLQEQDSPWRTLSKDRRYEDDFFSVDEHQVVNAAGHVAPYGVVHFKRRGLRILPVDDDGSLFLVGQFRYGAQYYSWELPAGGHEHGEDLKEAAARELGEEVGLKAECWLELSNYVPSGSLTDERDTTYLAWDLTSTRADSDEQEVLQVKRVPFIDAVHFALGGGIQDSGSVASLLAVYAKANLGELPSDLMQRLTRGNAIARTSAAAG